MAVVTYKDTMKRFLQSPMRKTYSFAGVTLIVVAIFLFGAIRPTLVTISRLRTEIKERESIDQILQYKLNTLQALSVDYTEREDNLSFIDDLYPSNSDFSILMANLERITSKYEFTLQSLQIGNEDDANAEQEALADPNALSQVQARMIVEGSRNRLVELVDHIENLPEVPDVERVTFSPSDNEDLSSAVHATIEFYVYKVN